MKLHALAPPGDLYARKRMKEKKTCCWPLVTIGEEARRTKAKAIMSLPKIFSCSCFQGGWWLDWPCGGVDLTREVVYISEEGWTLTTEGGWCCGNDGVTVREESVHFNISKSVIKPKILFHLLNFQKFLWDILQHLPRYPYK